ncbi:MAG: WbqC family protein [Bacteroidia bacterium]|nr:WbqC family protein [Bacteroidia bacterium]
MESNPKILSIAYFGSVQYYTKFLNFNVLIEAYENYIKQSYRNRCEIYGANGRLTLSVPVEKNAESKVLIKNVKICYRTNWQKLHFKSIESAYSSSPFYKYYVEPLIPFFIKKYKFLFDLDIEIHKTLLKFLKIESHFSLTSQFTSVYPAFNDFRNSIHPKIHRRINAPCYTPYKYPQVFSGKYGFLPDLSVIDLLFNTGPDAICFLKKSAS